MRTLLKILLNFSLLNISLFSQAINIEKDYPKLNNSSKDNIIGSFTDKNNVSGNIKVIYPNGGERILANSNRVIRWTEIQRYDVKIEITYDGEIN